MHVVVSSVTRMKYGGEWVAFDIGKLLQKVEEEVDDGVDAKDIQQSRWMIYDVPEDVDDEELDAELKALEDEMEIGCEHGESIPSFMVDEMPQSIRLRAEDRLVDVIEIETCIQESTTKGPSVGPGLCSSIKTKDIFLNFTA